ncbi:hypothetical protein H0X09_03175 [Candidatus Saccharibacteria bacterium]|nr:hypothetical protein [Candidatus Saccharibacteria bacterium]
MLAALKDIRETVRQELKDKQPKTYESKINEANYRLRLAQTLGIGAVLELGLATHSEIQNKPAASLLALAIGGVCLSGASYNVDKAGLNQEQANQIQLVAQFNSVPNVAPKLGS